MRYIRYRVLLALISGLTFIFFAAPDLVSAASLQLSWIDNSQNEDGFNVERKLGAGGAFSLVATTGPGATSYSDAGLADNTNYCYRVNAFNSAGSSAYTNEACATTASPGSTPPPVAPPGTAIPPVTAVLLGQTGEDVVGTTSLGADGVPDVHIRLSGVQSPVTGVTITDGGIGVWQTPYNGHNWIVAINPEADPSIVDLFYDFWQPASSFTVALTFADGSAQTIQASSSSTVPSPVASPPTPVLPVTAVLLGQTGEDIVGTTSLGADGVQDVHIRLSGVQSPVAGVTITDGGIGVWQTPYNGHNWIVAINPEANPSIVDLFYDFWQPASSFTVALTFADGSAQTGQTSMAIASVQSSTAPATTTVLSNSNSNSSTVTQSTVVVDAVSKIGVFRPDTGEWFLDRNGNGLWDGCASDICIPSFGQAGDVPVTRKIGTLNRTLIGVFRQGTWIFDSNGSGTLDNCSVDECDSFGAPGDLPVTGDWSGSGTEAIGVFEPSTGGWLLDNNGNGQWDGCNVDTCLGPFGINGDLPVAGDWDGIGKVRIGVYRPSTGQWFLDMNGNGGWDGCNVDKCLGPFGADGDLPIVGDWDGTGKVRIGVYRPSTGQWLLDINGNGNFDGCTVDLCLGPFGQPGDIPVTAPGWQ